MKNIDKEAQKIILDATYEVTFPTDEIIDDLVEDFAHVSENLPILTKDEIGYAMTVIDTNDGYVADFLRHEQKNDETEFMKGLLYYYAKVFLWETKTCRKYEGEEMTEEIVNELRDEMNNLK